MDTYPTNAKHTHLTKTNLYITLLNDLAQQQYDFPHTTSVLLAISFRILVACLLGAGVGALRHRIRLAGWMGGARGNNVYMDEDDEGLGRWIGNLIPA